MTREKELESIPASIRRMLRGVIFRGGRGRRTSQTAHQQDTGESNKNVHQWGPEERIDISHDVKADVAGAVEDQGELHGHFLKSLY